jgi:hypothetical protein
MAKVLSSIGSARRVCGNQEPASELVNQPTPDELSWQRATWNRFHVAWLSSLFNESEDLKNMTRDYYKSQISPTAPPMSVPTLAQMAVK